jgi:hypothetical protein
MKRSLLATVLLVGLLVAGRLVHARQPAAPPAPLLTSSPTMATVPVAPAPPGASAPKEDPLLAELDCLVATPPRCKVGGSAASLGHHGTRILLRDLARVLEGCRAGKEGACLEIGSTYELGVVVDAAPDKAALFYERACDRELAEGCRSLRSLYRQAKGVSRDEMRAKALLQRALELDCADDPTTSGCDALLSTRKGGKKAAPDASPGSARPVEDKASTLAHDERAGGEARGESCSVMAAILPEVRDQAELEALLARIEPCLKPLCEADDEACAALGETSGLGLENGPVRYRQQLCDAGDAISCALLARFVYTRMTFEDRGRAADLNAERRRNKHASVLRLDERACALGYAPSCAKAGEVYEQGSAGEEDADGALKAYTRECALNRGNGCWNEARLAGAKTALVVEPERVTLALLRARAIYEEDCHPENDPVSCKRAGDLHDGRNGLDADPKRRAQLHRQSVRGLKSECETDPDACRELIDLYEHGLGGLKRDEKKLRKLRKDLCSLTFDCDETEKE